MQHLHDDSAANSDREMEETLELLGFSESVLEKFKQEKIHVSTVPLLTDEDLVSLGVEKLGERARLRKHCQDIIKSTKVSQEVRSVMGSPPITTYNVASHDYSSIVNVKSAIPRRSKRKYRPAEKCISTKKGPTSTFQKKLVVFKYMGPRQPKEFTLCEERIMLRGLLPAISNETSETDIRKEICATIIGFKAASLASCTKDDFEFIDVNGKRASVPNFKEGFEFDGRAIKQLAGSGCLYVRLTRQIQDDIVVIDDSFTSDRAADSTDSDSSLPPFTCRNDSISVQDSSHQIPQSVSSSSLQVTSPLCRSSSHDTSTYSRSSSQSSLSASSLQGSSRLSSSRSSLQGSSGSSLHSSSRSSLQGSSGSSCQGSSRPSLQVSSGPSLPSFSGSSLHTSSRSSLQVSSGPSLQGFSGSSLQSFSGSSFQGSSGSSLQDSLGLSLQSLSESSFQGSSVSSFQDSSELSIQGSCMSLSYADSNPEHLVDVFPDFSLEMVNYIYETTGRSYEKTIDFFASGVTKESLMSLVRSKAIVIPLEESPRIRLESDDDDNDWAKAAIAFYKGRFEDKAHVKISIRQQAGVDTGGIRRQFFAVVFDVLAHSPSFGLFEGFPDSVRPAFRATNLSSGVLVLLGVMIGHSLLLDSQGFPYLSEYCFYYIIGHIDRAMTCVTKNDLSEDVKTIIEVLEDVESDKEMSQLVAADKILDMMEKAGCDLPLSVKHKTAIVETLILYDAIHKRAPYLDAIGEGLNRLGLKRLLHIFPDTMKSFFVSSGIITPEDVIKSLKPTNVHDKELLVWKYLESFLRNCNCEVCYWNTYTIWKNFS